MKECWQSLQHALYSPLKSQRSCERRDTAQQGEQGAITSLNLTETDIVSGHCSPPSVSKHGPHSWLCCLSSSLAWAIAIQGSTLETVSTLRRQGPAIWQLPVATATWEIKGSVGGYLCDGTGPWRSNVSVSGPPPYIPPPPSSPLTPALPPWWFSTVPMPSDCRGDFSWSSGKVWAGGGEWWSRGDYTDRKCEDAFSLDLCIQNVMFRSVADFLFCSSGCLVLSHKEVPLHAWDWRNTQVKTLISQHMPRLP